MKRQGLWLILLCGFLFWSLSSAGMAAPLQSAMNPARPVLPVVAEIGQQLQELVTGDPNAEIEPQETFGTRALGVLLKSSKLLISEASAFIDNFAALPQLSVWFDQQVTNVASRQQWGDTLSLLLLVVGGAFAAGWLADLVLLPLRRKIYRTTLPTPLSKFFAVMSWLGLSLVPVIVFVGTALAIIDMNDPAKLLVRFLVMTVVYALALVRLVRVVLRFFLAPRAPLLRLVPLMSEQCVFIQTWVTWYSSIAIFGAFIAEMAKVVKVPVEAISGFKSLVALVIVVMTVALIVHKRAYVSTFLRGDLSAAQKRLTLGQSLRLWLARTWHVLAIAYLVIGYFVTMLGPAGGFAAMQQGTVGTIVVLLAMRLVFYLASRLDFQKTEEHRRSGIYRPLLKFFLKLAAWVAGALGIAFFWGVDVAALLASPWGQRVMGSALSISSTLFVLVLVYELIHAHIQRKLYRTDENGNVVQADARSMTLLPMVRNFAIIVLVLIGGMVTLSELGIDTTPLLAGAGVLGVALGFGSQTLVKDFLTGLFIIMENSIAVGDIVRIGENDGEIEGMTIRTVRLRDSRGSLHILPFSEISRIVNMSKEFAFALVEVGVAYDSDIEKVMKVMEEVGAELQKDPSVGPDILEPLKVMGLENFADSSIKLRARMKTIGGKQFDVRRAYLLKLKLAFDREKIEIPYPHVVQIRKE